MIRAVEINMNIQNTPEMARMLNNANQARPDITAQQFTDRLDKQTKLQQEQVQKTEEATKNDVNPDRRGDGGGYQGNKKKPPAKKTLAKPAKPANRGDGESMFNILV